MADRAGGGAEPGSPAASLTDSSTGQGTPHTAQDTTQSLTLWVHINSPLSYINISISGRSLSDIHGSHTRFHTRFQTRKKTHKKLKDKSTRFSTVIYSIIQY